MGGFTSHTQLYLKTLAMPCIMLWAFKLAPNTPNVYMNMCTLKDSPTSQRCLEAAVEFMFKNVMCRYSGCKGQQKYL